VKFRFVVVGGLGGLGKPKAEMRQDRTFALFPDLSLWLAILGMRDHNMVGALKNSAV
jgi:hypothetical protein